MPKVLAIDTDLCVGCERCALMCSFAKYKVYNPKRSAIATVKFEPGADAAVFCIQCGTCINACPTEALKRDTKLMAVVLDEEKCNGCGQCVPACPVGILRVDPIINKAIKCDHCLGDPACAKYCPQGALKFIDVDEAMSIRRILTAKGLTQAPSVSTSPPRKLWYKL